MPKFAANLSMLFTEAPFLDRFEAAAQAGFRGVEFLFPYEHDARDIAAQLGTNGLEQVLFNLPAGDWAGGERGIAIFANRRDEFRDGVQRAIDYAKALRCPQLHCLAGNAPDGADHAALNQTYIENLRFAADQLAKAGLSLLIEPINTRDMPGYFLTRTAQARDVIASIGAQNVFLQYDAYHMHIMEGGLLATTARNLDAIGHVQIADAPGRHEPGTGDIDFAELFEHLDRIGYAGWIGCEYRPRTTTADSLAWMNIPAANPDSKIGK
jgi:hydroxypyruvate isomerase